MDLIINEMELHSLSSPTHAKDSSFLLKMVERRREIFHVSELTAIQRWDLPTLVVPL